MERVGKYEVLAPLSEGGMAQLYLGATKGPGGFRKYVVIKRVLPTAAGDENFERMFLDEARVTAAFSHPAIAQVFDLGEDDEGLYVVMEFIAGQNLNQVTNACARQRAILPLGFSTAVLHDCALALHYAHTFRSAAGESSPVIHRDVAQKNIMVTWDGQVKLLDFGIAKVKNGLSRTRAGTVKGTAGYMSPEQVRGQTLDGRSDVFALGVVLWEMTTGKRLFTAETEIEELRMILEREPPLASEVEESVSPELGQLIQRALEKSRDARFPSAREFARALNTACASQFYDADARAEFMRERFESKIQSTRALFEMSDSSSDAEVQSAIQNYQRQSHADDELPRRARNQLSGGKLEPIRRVRSPSKTRIHRVEEPPPTRIHAVVEEAVPRTNPEHLRSGFPWPLIITLTLLGVGGASWWYLVDQQPSTGRSQTWADIPGTDQPVLPVEPSDEPSADASISPRAQQLPEKTEKKPRTVTVEVTLALIPEAKVMLGSQLLAEGSLVKFALPTGTHLLTVVGPDGVEHVLSLPVSPKTKMQKFHVNELPVR